MKNLWAAPVMVGLCLCGITADAAAQSPIDAMRISQLRYQEGSHLIKSGESAKARAAFNEAVNLILKSEWDLNSDPVLNRFFQDLIQRIQQDETRYLQPGEWIDDLSESAVVDELEKLDLIPITVDPSLKDVVETDLASSRYDIPIVLNESVLQSLNYWLNRGRKYFLEGLMRSGRYSGMIRRVFREAGLPLDLMYLAQVESLFKPQALSRRSAKGIWQFGKHTAIRYGLKVNNYIDERSDPEKSTLAAARYLSDLYAMFQDWNLVLAAYNWGEGHVQRLVNRSGLNDFWDLLDLRRNFPKETKNHVPLIQASVILARNPEKYGLPIELEPPLTFERIKISKPVDLRAVAKTLQVPVDRLKVLNSSLRRYTTPPNYPDFELKIPQGTDPSLVEKIAQLPAVKPEPAVLTQGKHKVRPGETLSAIAERYRVSVAALQEANNLGSPRSLRAGSLIRIPASARSTVTRPKNASLVPAASKPKKTQIR